MNGPRNDRVNGMGSRRAAGRPSGGECHRTSTWPNRTWGRGAVGKRRAARWGCLGLVLLLLATLAGPASASTEAAGRDRVLPQLMQEASRQPEQTFRVLVTRAGKNADADRQVAAKGGKKTKEVAGNAFVAEVKGKHLADLGKHPGVKWVTPDAQMALTGVVDGSSLANVYNQPISYNNVIEAAGLWASGITGAGVGVAVLDTGINYDRPDFKNSSGGDRVVADVLFNSEVKGVKDGHGHGTIIAGIIAGNSWWSGDATVRGKYVGIAPEANLINVRVSNDLGVAYVSDVVNAIDWVISVRQAFNIRVMNLSLISSVAESCDTSPLCAAVQKAWLSGILVVVASGNLGPDTMLYPPANDAFVVTVGAADPMGTNGTADDGVATWSSYGTTQAGVSKPDVVAPGRYIIAPLASNSSKISSKFAGRKVGNGYVWMSGTSLSAPIVAGLAALAYQANPTWGNDHVKWLLVNTATRLGTVAGQGAGEVNARAVVTYSGTPGLANQGLPISQHLQMSNGETTYSTTSTWSTSTWSTSTWSTSTWSTSTWSTSTWSTSTWSTSTWSTGTWQAGEDNLDIE